LEVRYFRRISFEHAALLGAGAFIAYLLSRYDVCFQDAEFLTVYMIDAGERVRVLDYVANIVALNTRLALWSVIFPHPSFTPMWVLTLGVGPVLLYRFLRAELDSRPGALAGVSVFLASAGCLSGVTMLFHQAKPLAVVGMIATLTLSSRINRVMRNALGNGAPAIHRVPPLSWIALLALLTVLPFADEAASFAYVVPLVWAPRAFWPREYSRSTVLACLGNWFMYAIPVCLVALAVLVVLPPVFDTPDRRFDLIEYMRRMALEGAPHAKFDLHHVAWQSGNLLIPGLLPWSFSQVRTPVAADPQLPSTILVGLAAALALATAIVRWRRTYWSFCRKLIILLSLYVVFQTLVLVFHPEELSATGFYYGATFSVFFASLIAVIYADCAAHAGAPAFRVARLGLVWVLVVSAMNILSLTASWRMHSNFKAIALSQFEVRSHGADTALLKEQATRYSVAYGTRPDLTEAYYIGDIAPQGPAAPRRDVRAIWRKWRNGDADYLAGQPLTFRTLWIAGELDMKARATVRKEWISLPWH